MPDNMKRPGPLWTAIVILYVQAVLNAAGGVLFVYLAAEEADHGREAPELSVLGYVSIVIGVALLAGAVLLTRGVAWARIPVAVIESLGILSGLIVIFSGTVTGVIGVVLSVLVLVHLFRREVSAWFDDVRAATPAA